MIRDLINSACKFIKLTSSLRNGPNATIIKKMKMTFGFLKKSSKNDIIQILISYFLG